jgi:GNAT superfamily N-acetyltransferase
MIRSAEQRDLADVLRLARDFATSFTVDEAAFRRSVAAVLAAPDAYLAVAEVGEQVVGYVLAFRHPAFFANGPVAWIEEIMVDPHRQRQGIGRRLMDNAELWAATHGCALLALATRRAAPFYQALGYDESATYFRKLL